MVDVISIAKQPVIVLFTVAVLMTLWARATRCVLDTSNKIACSDLQNTISVVAFVDVDQIVDPYVDMLRSAKWPARVQLRIFKALGPDEALPRVADSRVKIAMRYGKFDAAQSRDRVMRESTGSKYILLVSQAVDALYAWDEALVRMLEKCPAPRPVLTTVPASAGVTSDTRGSFLCVGKTGETLARQFVASPTRPQPSLFWTAHMSFSKAEDLRYPPVHLISVESESMACTQYMWTKGIDFFAPPFCPLTIIEKHRPSRKLPQREPTNEWHADENSERTTREWNIFVGRRVGNKWSRRSLLGLTLSADHEERYSKYGSMLEMHGL